MSSFSVSTLEIDVTAASTDGTCSDLWPGTSKDIQMRINALYDLLAKPEFPFHEVLVYDNYLIPS